MFNWARKFFGDVKNKVASAYTGIMGYSLLPLSVERMLVAADQNVWFSGVVHKAGDVGAELPWTAYEKRDGHFQARVPRKMKTRSSATRKAVEAAIESKELVEVDHPFLSLLDRPNPTMDKWEFMYSLIGHFIVTGEMFIHKVRDARGFVVEMYVLTPTWVKKTPTAKEPWFVVERNGRSDELPERDIVWKKRPRLIDPYHRGSGIGAALQDEISIDQQAAQTQYAYFANGARPSILIGIEDADEETVMRAKARWNAENQGPSRAGSTHFYSGKITTDTFGESLADMEMSTLRREQRNAVIQGAGVPPEIMGILDNSNRSTIEAADFFYRTFVLKPILDRIWYAFQFDVMPECGGSKEVLLDYHNPIPEDMATKYTGLKIAPSVLTINEWRNLLGYRSIPEGVKMFTGTAAPKERGDLEREEDAQAKEDKKYVF